MRAGFLLRFQESPRPVTTDERTTKTRTHTEKEKPDEGLVMPLAGTKTLTEIKAEAADKDPNSGSLHIIPR